LLKGEKMKFLDVHQYAEWLVGAKDLLETVARVVG
jgi:hypothetical protein